MPIGRQRHIRGVMLMPISVWPNDGDRVEKLIWSSNMGLLTGFKKSSLEKKFRKNDWVIIQAIPLAEFEQFIVDYVDVGWEIEDDYVRLLEDTPKWECTLKKGTSILTCIWTMKERGQVYGPSRVLNGLAEKLKMKPTTTISQPWF